MRVNILPILLIILSLNLAINSARSQSIFQKAGLLTIQTAGEGVYKLDASFFTNVGISIESLNPQRIALYGLRGGMLKQLNTGDFDLYPKQIPLWFSGNDDNQFQQSEFFYFYADGVDDFYFDSATESYRYSKNVYADNLRFFIDLDSDSARRMSVQSSTATSGDVISSYHDFQIHEEELFNLLNSGKTWLGESFEFEKTLQLDFPLQGNIAGSENIELQLNYIAQTFSEAQLSVSINGFSLLNEDLQTVPDFAINPYTVKGRAQHLQSQLPASLFSAATSSLALELTHQPQGSGRSTGWLDYAMLQIPYALQNPQGQILIRNPRMNQSGIYSLEFESFSAAHHLWDVSDAGEPLETEFNNSTFVFDNSAAIEKTFIAFTDQSVRSPQFMGRTDAFDLLGGNPDYVIISHRDFLAQAERLATHRSNHNSYEVKVVALDQLYNQFSSGRADVTAIRNYLAALYAKPESKIKYALLFGGGSFDYKNILGTNKNFVPVYQSNNYLHPVFTYASDDFYGFLEVGEGEWSEEETATEDLDIGIGRIPAINSVEAQTAVDKIIYYESNNAVVGSWKNKIALVADDEDGNLHHSDAEKLDAIIQQNHKNYDVDKLYLGAFPQEFAASSQKSDAMVEALQKRIERGALIVNYTGHGAENTWADESILNQNLFQEWKNLDRLPLVVTATCEFGRHDNPIVRSGAEKMLLQQGGGAIGLLTTSRPVFSSSNAALNQAFFRSVFKDSLSNSALKLGDIIRSTKNQSVLGVNNRNFVLLGDPALTLTEPSNTVRIDEIRAGENLSDTLRSLDRIVIAGHVENSVGTLLTNFNGVVDVELFDKKAQKQTIAPENGPLFTFREREGVLFRGRASVTDGEFSIELILPAEMDYSFGDGKLSLYAFDENSGKEANGFSTDLVIGGSGNDRFDDQEGPDIDLSLNDRNFVEGSTVEPDALLLIDLEDENGISLSNSELNPGIRFKIDDQPYQLLNDYYSAQLDTYQEGSIAFPINDLEEGEHRITVQARDVFNNLSERSIRFRVGPPAGITLSDIVIYPNPAQRRFNLAFSHNREDDRIEVLVDMLSTSGRVVFARKTELLNENPLFEIDLTKESGAKIPAGLYVIRTVVRSIEDNSKTIDFKKLIVID